jgi:hypothetical protein
MWSNHENNSYSDSPNIVCVSSGAPAAGVRFGAWAVVTAISESDRQDGRFEGRRNTGRVQPQTRTVPGAPSPSVSRQSIPPRSGAFLLKMQIRDTTEARTTEPYLVGTGHGGRHDPSGIDQESR